MPAAELRRGHVLDFRPLLAHSGHAADLRAAAADLTAECQP
jgi:hypothetical protein